MRLSEFNALAPDDAAGVVAVWAAIPRWVDEVVAARPYASVDALDAHARALAAEWTGADLDTALADHPRIGEKPAGEGAQADASRSEQASMSTAADDVTAAIAEGNAAYERRFGRVFLIRAAGRTPDEMLAALRRRMAADEADETAEAVAQLGEIALLRLAGAVEDDGPRHLTTHVLDAATGSPATGVEVVLATAGALPGDGGVEIARGRTDADGRLALGPARLDAGSYALSFLTGPYFSSRGVAAFSPFVTVAFTVEVADDGTSRHYHVPLLLSPFAYSTYRGS